MAGKKTGSIRVMGTLSAGAWQRIHRTYLRQSDSYTKLLLHGDGTDGSSTILDASTNTRKTVTVNGNAQIDTDQKKFGSGSILFDGAGDYLSFDDSDDWNYGNGDFTIEFFVWFNSLTAEYAYIGLYHQYQYAVSRISFIYYPVDNKLLFQSSTGSPQTYQANYSVNWTPELNKWYHVAAVRYGTNFYIFIDGVSQTLTTSTAISTNSLPDVDSTLSIGRYNDSGGSGSFNGRLDEYRISKGIARYTSNFTPPTEMLAGDDPVTSVTIPNLDGNTDEMYLVRCKIYNSYNGGTLYFLRPNNDTANNYGFQLIRGTSTTVSAARNTAYSGLYLAGNDAIDNIAQVDIFLYAKSGQIRLALIDGTDSIATTTIGYFTNYGQCWSNTADNITQMVLASSAAKGIGQGSVIEVYRRPIPA
jgi:hypothetical protein